MMGWGDVSPDLDCELNGNPDDILAWPGLTVRSYRCDWHAAEPECEPGLAGRIERRPYGTALRRRCSSIVILIADAASLDTRSMEDHIRFGQAALAGTEFRNAG